MKVGGARRLGGARKGGDPNCGGAHMFAFFLLSRRKTLSFFSFCGFSCGLWPWFKAKASPKCALGFSGVILCELHRPTVQIRPMTVLLQQLLS